jgi:restriction system protein
MAARKSGGEQFLDELFDLLRNARWWVGPIIIGIAYTLLAWMGPFFLTNVVDRVSGGQVPIGSTLATVMRTLAPWGAFLVTLMWLAALVAKAVDARRLDIQESIETIRDLSWREFEQLLAESFRRQGYKVVETGPGADGGVDLVLTRDGDTSLVQCKQWKQRKVGVKPVRELYGVVASRSVSGGVFVTSGDYTAEARRFAETVPLDLIAGPELETMVRSVQHGATDAATPRPAPVAAQPSAPDCPQCGNDMVRRVARRGAHTGKAFWGCSNFPGCRGTRPLEG